jgi:predicted glutamine amidotransferase
MCRMMALVSKKPIPSIMLEEFRALAERGKVLPDAKHAGHKDGWGIVCYRDNKPIVLGKEPTYAMEDAKYGEACQKLDKRCFKGVLLAHLRKASRGGVNPQNTAPFVKNIWCFGHNGTTHYFDAKPEMPRDITDSMFFFEAILSNISRLGRVDKAIGVCVQEVIKAEHSSLTFLLSDGKSVYAYREYSDPRDADYYNLMFAIDGSRVIVSQEPIWPREWMQIPNRSLAIVQSDLKVSIQRLG